MEHHQGHNFDTEHQQRVHKGAKSDTDDVLPGEISIATVTEKKKMSPDFDLRTAPTSMQGSSSESESDLHEATHRRQRSITAIDSKRDDNSRCQRQDKEPVRRRMLLEGGFGHELISCRSCQGRNRGIMSCLARNTPAGLSHCPRLRVVRIDPRGGEGAAVGTRLAHCKVLLLPGQRADNSSKDGTIEMLLRLTPDVLSLRFMTPCDLCTSVGMCWDRGHIGSQARTLADLFSDSIKLPQRANAPFRRTVTLEGGKTVALPRMVTVKPGRAGRSSWTKLSLPLAPFWIHSDRREDMPGDFEVAEHMYSSSSGSSHFAAIKGITEETILRLRALREKLSWKYGSKVIHPLVAAKVLYQWELRHPDEKRLLSAILEKKGDKVFRFRVGEDVPMVAFKASELRALTGRKIDEVKVLLDTLTHDEINAGGPLEEQAPAAPSSPSPGDGVTIPLSSTQDTDLNLAGAKRGSAGSDSTGRGGESQFNTCEVASRNSVMRRTSGGTSSTSSSSSSSSSSSRGAACFEQTTTEGDGNGDGGVGVDKPTRAVNAGATPARSVDAAAGYERTGLSRPAFHEKIHRRIREIESVRDVATNQSALPQRTACKGAQISEERLVGLQLRGPTRIDASVAVINGSGFVDLERPQGKTIQDELELLREGTRSRIRGKVGNARMRCTTTVDGEPDSMSSEVLAIEDEAHRKGIASPEDHVGWMRPQRARSASDGQDTTMNASKLDPSFCSFPHDSPPPFTHGTVSVSVSARSATASMPPSPMSSGINTRLSVNEHEANAHKLGRGEERNAPPPSAGFRRRRGEIEHAAASVIGGKSTVTAPPLNLSRTDFVGSLCEGFARPRGGTEDIDDGDVNMAETWGYLKRKRPSRQAAVEGVTDAVDSGARSFRRFVFLEGGEKAGGTAKTSPGVRRAEADVKDKGDPQGKACMYPRGEAGRVVMPGAHTRRDDIDWGSRTPGVFQGAEAEGSGMVEVGRGAAWKRKENRGNARGTSSESVRSRNESANRSRDIDSSGAVSGAAARQAKWLRAVAENDEKLALEQERLRRESMRVKDAHLARNMELMAWMIDEQSGKHSGSGSEGPTLASSTPTS